MKIRITYNIGEKSFYKVFNSFIEFEEFIMKVHEVEQGSDLYVDVVFDWNEVKP